MSPTETFKYEIHIQQRGVDVILTAIKADIKYDLLNNRKWLYEKHWDEQYTVEEIASLCNCHVTTVRNRLKQFNRNIIKSSEIISGRESENLSDLRTMEFTCYSPEDIPMSIANDGDIEKLNNKYLKKIKCGPDENDKYKMFINDLMKTESDMYTDVYNTFCNWCIQYGFSTVLKGTLYKCINNELNIRGMSYNILDDIISRKGMGIQTILDQYVLNNCEIKIGDHIEKVFKKDNKWYYRDHICQCGCYKHIKVKLDHLRTGNIETYFNLRHRQNHEKIVNNNGYPVAHDISSSDYKIIFSPRHSKTIQYHRYVMEEFLRRKLTADEIVHHKDLDKSNNNLDNLIICNKNQHAKYHFDSWKLITELVRTGMVLFDKDNGYYFSGEMASFMYEP